MSTPDQFPAIAERDPVRAKIEEYLSGMAMVREGLFNVFFIELEEEKGVAVYPDNVDEMEAQLRETFSERYPDLVMETE